MKIDIEELKTAAAYAVCALANCPETLVEMRQATLPRLIVDALARMDELDVNAIAVLCAVVQTKTVLDMKVDALINAAVAKTESAKSTVKTLFFTFGTIAAHRHELSDGTFLHSGTILMVRGESPRKTVVDVFGDKWAFQYNRLAFGAREQRGALSLTYWSGVHTKIYFWNERRFLREDEIRRIVETGSEK